MQTIKSIISTILIVFIVLLSAVVERLEGDPLWMDS